MEEHQLILRALDALDAFVATQLRGGDDRAELSRFVRFIREFADVRHHGKEENFLFEAMMAGGFPRDGGPSPSCSWTTTPGEPTWRRWPRRRSSRAPGATRIGRPWRKPPSATPACSAATSARRTRILYPMARQRLPEGALARVDRECVAFEAKQVAAGNDSVKDLGRELVARHAAA